MLPVYNGVRDDMYLWYKNRNKVLYTSLNCPWKKSFKKNVKIYYRILLLLDSWYSRILKIQKFYDCAGLSSKSSIKQCLKHLTLSERRSPSKVHWIKYLNNGNSLTHFFHGSYSNRIVQGVNLVLIRIYALKLLDK